MWRFLKGLISSNGKTASMSKVMTWVAVVTVVSVIYYSLMFMSEISIQIVILTSELFIFALANRADSRRISLQFQGMSIEQERETHGKKETD